MNKSLATLIATAAAAGFSFAAHAQTTDTQPAPGTPGRRRGTSRWSRATPT